MNWGKKKKEDACSTRHIGMSSIAKMFRVSWFARKGGRKAERDASLVQDRRMSCMAEKFYGEAEENFWRLSFSDEGCQGRKSCKRSSEISTNEWRKEIGMPLSPSTCKSCGAKDAKRVVKKNESMDFTDMVFDLRKRRRDSYRHVGDTEVSRRDGRLRNNVEHHQLSFSTNLVANYAGLKDTPKKMAVEKGTEGDPRIQNSAVKDIMEVKPVKKPIQTCTKASHRSPSSSVSQSRYDQAVTPSKLDPELETLQCSLEQLSLGDGKERKSIYISNDSMKKVSKSGRRSKVKIYSPRTPSKAELCKIRALEDLKKTRMKMRVKEEEDGSKRALLESFAVVKRSFDPHKDFRRSMLEMILDKGISSPEELEELLACYLTLNSDEYHELIIKVFRQVTTLNKYNKWQWNQLVNFQLLCLRYSSKHIYVYCEDS